LKDLKKSLCSLGPLTICLLNPNPYSLEECTVVKREKRVTSVSMHETVNEALPSP
jgi:hypothetical protein